MLPPSMPHDAYKTNKWYTTLLSFLQQLEQSGRPVQVADGEGSLLHVSKSRGLQGGGLHWQMEHGNAPFIVSGMQSVCLLIGFLGVVPIGIWFSWCGVLLMTSPFLNCGGYFGG